MTNTAVDQLEAQARNLTVEQQQELAARLPYPKGDAALGRLWLTLIGGLLVVAILAGFAAFGLAGAGNDTAAAFLAIVTTIIGGLVGLFAPSPVSK